MGERRRVLVIDDEAAVRQSLARPLTEAGFDIVEAGDGAGALAAFDRHLPDAVVLDVGLPDANGFDVLQELRRRGDVPVILLTGRTDELDRILGLELGADDYVGKPFSAREVATRVKVVLRRGTAVSQDEALAFDGLVVDRRAREVVLDGRPVVLTTKEFDLLALLANSPRRAFSREEILRRVWGSSTEWQDPATVTEHVRRLRSKIERDPAHPRWIGTVRGIGYRFEP